MCQGARVRGTLRHFFEDMFSWKIKGYTFLKMFISCSKLPHWILYPYVLPKCFDSKIKYMFGGLNFSVSRCLSLPYIKNPENKRFYSLRIILIWNGQCQGIEQMVKFKMAARSQLQKRKKIILIIFFNYYITMVHKTDSQHCFLCSFSVCPKWLGLSPTSSFKPQHPNIQFSLIT